MDAAGGAQPRGWNAGVVRAGGSARLGALGVFLGCVAVLGASAWLTPAAAGHGTHEGLGLPPCTWAQTFDKPCMTCGMTTAFAYAADGDLLDSVRTQPFGFLLSVLTASTAWGALHVALTGSMLGRAAQRVLNGRSLWGALALLLAAWAYKFVTWEG